jgi:hypothetical protein
MHLTDVMIMRAPASAVLLSVTLQTMMAVQTGTASAQVPTAPESITPAPFAVRRPPADLERLTRLYNVSDWPGLQALAREIICVARRSAPALIQADDASEYETCPAESLFGGTAPETVAGTQRPVSDVAAALDLRRNHVAVMWLGEDAFGKPGLLRVVVSRGSGQPYGLDLPGVSTTTKHGQLVELFLSRSVQGRVTSLYTSTREDDPLLATLPAFVKALAGPLFATVGSIAGTLRATEQETLAPPQPKLAATVKPVGLPFRRAKVRFQAVAREPLSTDDFAGSAQRLASALRFNQVPRAMCARTLATTLAAELPGVTREAVCSAPTADPLQCLKAFDAVLTEHFDAAVKACEGGKPAAEERRALERVDTDFRELVNDGTSTGAELDVTFKNRPLSHFAFGAGGGVMARASLSRPRVTTKNGVLVADPLDRVMTTAFVNWSPAGYDPEDPRLPVAERFRPFFGAALTPDFGPAIGLNVLLVRGIGITAGGALLFGTGADTDEVGTAPSRPDDPYKLSIARAVFVGLSFSYK